MESLQTSTKQDYHAIDLRFFLHTLIEKKWFIISMSLVIFVFAMTYITFKPKQYQATVLLQIYHKQQNSFGSIADSNKQTTMAGSMEEPISFQIALIRSKFILQSVIKSLGLDIQYSQRKESIFDLFKKNQNILQMSEFEVPAKYLNKKLNLIIDNHNHYRLRNSKKELLLEGNVEQLLSNKNGFSIKIDSINARVGSQFYIKKLYESEVINQIRSHLTITDLSVSGESTPKMAALLQLSFTGGNPDQIIKIINQIAMITQKKDMERKSLESKKTLEFLYHQLPIIQTSLKEAESKLNLYRANNGKIDIKLQTQYLLNHLREIDKELEMTQLKKMDMSQLYTSYHPFIIALDQKYKALTKRRYDILTQIKKLPSEDQVAANLARDVNVKNNLYILLLNKIHEQEVINAGIVSDIRILSFATFPDMPFTIKMTVIIVSSLMIGFVLSCLAVFINQIFTRRINNEYVIDSMS
jgi:tyrosine-protein kinase Etk/Wzc